MRMKLQDTLCQQDPTECFFSSILGPLRELKHPSGDLRYIVIDALDECFESNKTSEIIEMLSSKILHFPKWLKVILTSRNLTQVTEELPQVVRRMPLYANDDRNVKDIRLYVSRFISQNTFFVDRLKKAMNFKSGTYHMKIFSDEVITRAEGNFLFVKMTLQNMNDTDGAIYSKSLPISLFDLYNSFFKRQYGKGGFEPFRSLFGVLLFVGSPIQLNDVDELLRSEYEAGDVSQLIDQASCFLRFGLDGTVRIYHQSFADWLLNQSNVIRINETRAHQNIAKFLLHRINKNEGKVTLGEVIELFMHMLAGNTLEIHGNTIDYLNITEMREPGTNQSILHHLAVKSKPFHPVLEFLVPKFRTVDILDAKNKTFYAASENFVDNLGSFIDGGADVSSLLKGFEKLDFFMVVVRNSGIEEFSLIHAAAAKGYRGVVELLLKSGFNFFESSQNYPTPLRLAAGNGHLGVLKLFYDHGAQIDVITLHHAAAGNHSDVVEFLLGTVGVRDSCLECRYKTEHFSTFSVEDVHLYFCETALYAAVSRGHIDIVKILLAFGNESLECKHHSGKTVLMDAVERNDIEMVDLLLENGAKVTTQCGSKIPKRSKNEMCSLSSTYKHNSLYTIHCIEDSCKCGNTAIHISAKYGYWKVAQKLVNKQVFHLTKVFNCVNENAVAVAFLYGHTHYIYNTNETYKEQGYVLNGTSIFKRAVMRCSENAVKHMLDYPINCVDEHNWDFLLHSVHWNPTLPYILYTIVPYFCPEAVDDEDDNSSIEDWIQRVSRKRLAIIKLLVESCKEKSFILNKKDAMGYTLLQNAVANGFDDAVKYLHQIGANLRIMDVNSDSLLTIALTSGITHRSPNRNVWYRCYTTNDGQFSSCNTTSYDEIARYLIWSQGQNLLKCDARSASFLRKIIEKQMPLSLYELLKVGLDMNCKEYALFPRPFLQHLRLGERQLSEVFQIFEVNISLECGVTFTSSELHLISYLAVLDDLGNFFKPIKKDRSPLQKVIDRHPDGFGILEKCYDSEGYLPLHRAVQGGNLDAIIWFKNVGVNMQLKTHGGLTAFDLSMLYLSDISQAELIASIVSTPYSWRRSKHQVPLTISSYRTQVFEELLLTFFKATPEFLCGASLEGLSPLHIAAVKGMSVLRYVHKKASEFSPNLSLNCANKRQLDPVYVAHFYESLLNEGLTDIYSKNYIVNFGQENVDLKTNNNDIDNDNNNNKRNEPQSNRTNMDRKDSPNSKPLIQYPDHEVEYYMAFDYLYYPFSSKYTVEGLHVGIPKDIRISDCPGYHDKISNRKEGKVQHVNFTECSKIQVRHHFYWQLCEREILQNFNRKYTSCLTLTMRLHNWVAIHQRKNRQISKFVANRLGWYDVPEVTDINYRWPLFFLHNMVLKKYESLKYLKILNEALEVADVRFCSRDKPLHIDDLFDFS